MNTVTKKNKLVLQHRRTIKKINLRGLGLIYHQKTVWLFFQSSADDAKTFRVATSNDGFDFELFKTHLTISLPEGKLENIGRCSDFHVVKIKKSFRLLYRKTVRNRSSFHSATSKDLITWRYEGPIKGIHETGIVAPQYLHKQKYVMYWGEHALHCSHSKNIAEWELSQQPILSPRHEKFDHGPIEVEYVMPPTDKGIHVIYHSKITSHNHTTYQVGIALFDANNPEKLLWRGEESIWHPSNEWAHKGATPIGVATVQGKIIAYWSLGSDGIFAVVYSFHKQGAGLLTKTVSLDLEKSHKNPIIAPNDDNTWEAMTTFNPAAIHAGGKVHIIYRAQGHNYISVLGYAASSDGIHIDERHDEPIYIPKEPFEYTGSLKPEKVAHMYVSGGGYGGCEDPRITQIGDRMYMTYVAFNGRTHPRVALTSISVDDFLNHRWLWERPVLISPPGIVNKNAVLFSEKINGKYVIMHRVYPNILIDFVDDLAFDGSTKWLEGHYKIEPRRNMWDSKKIGAGAPPIKTKDGWLLIYQSVGYQDTGRYKIGAMVLDSNDPTKVLYRANAPILEPTLWYENHGFKAGVAYPCGAVVINNTLFVYYGGADSHVCVATANLDTFLAELKHSDIHPLRTALIRKIL